MIVYFCWSLLIAYVICISRTKELVPIYDEAVPKLLIIDNDTNHSLMENAASEESLMERQWYDGTLNRTGFAGGQTGTSFNDGGLAPYGAGWFVSKIGICKRVNNAFQITSVSAIQIYLTNIQTGQVVIMPRRGGLVVRADATCQDWYFTIANCANRIALVAGSLIDSITVFSTDNTAHSIGGTGGTVFNYNFGQTGCLKGIRGYEDPTKNIVTALQFWWGTIPAFNPTFNSFSSQDTAYYGGNGGANFRTKAWPLKDMVPQVIEVGFIPTDGIVSIGLQMKNVTGSQTWYPMETFGGINQGIIPVSWDTGGQCINQVNLCLQKRSNSQYIQAIQFFVMALGSIVAQSPYFGPQNNCAGGTWIAGFGGPGGAVGCLVGFSGRYGNRIDRLGFTYRIGHGIVSDSVTTCKWNHLSGVTGGGSVSISYTSSFTTDTGKSLTATEANSFSASLGASVKVLGTGASTTFTYGYSNTGSTTLAQKVIKTSGSTVQVSCPPGRGDIWVWELQRQSSGLGLGLKARSEYYICTNATVPLCPPRLFDPFSGCSCAGGNCQTCMINGKPTCASG